jgi:hypothetical protein
VSSGYHYLTSANTKSTTSCAENSGALGLGVTPSCLRPGDDMWNVSA